jgi:hypothetical protein
MTGDQMALRLRERERIERQGRAASIADMHCAASGIMGDPQHVQERIDELNGG